MSRVIPSRFACASLYEGAHRYWIGHRTRAAMPSDSVPLDRLRALSTFRHWCRQGRLGRRAQCDLYLSMHPVSHNLCDIHQATMEHWIERKVADGTFLITVQRHVNDTLSE